MCVQVLCASFNDHLTNEGRYCCQLHSTDSSDGFDSLANPQLSRVSE